MTYVSITVLKHSSVETKVLLHLEDEVFTDIL